MSNSRKEPVPPTGQSSVEFEIDAALLNPLARINLEQLGQTVERPLFTPTRRPPTIIKKKKPVVRKPPNKRPDTKAFSRVGVVSGNGMSIALLRERASGAIVKLQTGETAKGWRVEK